MMRIPRLSTALWVVALWALGLPVAAQSLNERWHGSWSSGKHRFLVNASSFEGCRWVGSSPKTTPTGCVAFYDGTVSRKALFSVLQSESEMVDQLAKNGHAGPKEVQAMRAQIKAERTKLESISDETFRIVRMWDPANEGSGDCQTYRFLDKTRIYQVSGCQGPAEPTFSITVYSK